jgi:hypothetical protein
MEQLIYSIELSVIKLLSIAYTVRPATDLMPVLREIFLQLKNETKIE